MEELWMLILLVRVQKLAKYNILVQASASMLAQANQSPQVALMLLG